VTNLDNEFQMDVVGVYYGSGFPKAKFSGSRNCLHPGLESHYRSPVADEMRAVVFQGRRATAFAPGSSGDMGAPLRGSISAPLFDRAEFDAQLMNCNDF
jgi:hypothetical protein